MGILSRWGGSSIALRIWELLLYRIRATRYRRAPLSFHLLNTSFILYLRDMSLKIQLNLIRFFQRGTSVVSFPHINPKDKNGDINVGNASRF